MLHLAGDKGRNDVREQKRQKDRETERERVCERERAGRTMDNVFAKVFLPEEKDFLAFLLKHINVRWCSCV